MECNREPLELLCKDLYPWFFNYLSAFEAYMFACATPYAYNAYLKYLRMVMVGFDIDDYKRTAHTRWINKQAWITTRREEWEYKACMRSRCSDVIEVICRHNESSRLLDGIMRLVAQPTRDFALGFCIRVRCPINVKMMLRWADPSCMTDKHMAYTCARDCHYLQIIRDVLTPEHPYKYESGVCPLHKQIIIILLQDKRCHVDIPYAMFLAIEYNDIVAFRLMLDTCTHIPLNILELASGKKYLEFVTALMPRVSTSSIKDLLYGSRQSPAIHHIVRAELKKRSRVPK